MAKADLYNVTIKSADATLATADFIAAQKKITAAVKRDIKRDLADRNLSAEFAFAAKKVPATARGFQVYATPMAIEVISSTKNVESVERMQFSMYSLTKKL